MAQIPANAIIIDSEDGNQLDLSSIDNVIVQGDVQTDIIYFMLPKYVNGMDISTWGFWIKGVNANQDALMDHLEKVYDERYPEKLLLKWIPSASYASTSGLTRAQISIESSDGKIHNTQLSKLRVAPGINIPEYADISSQLLEAVLAAANRAEVAATAAADSAKLAEEAVEAVAEAAQIVKDNEEIIQSIPGLVERAETAGETAVAASESATASATAASNSATNAATSETSADTSAKASAKSASDSEASASAAADSASDATDSANAATTSETNAKASEDSATASATAASNSATNAATSATNAATSETNAEESATNADTSAQDAAASAAAAALSEKNAKTSETNSKTSETNAGISAATASEKAQEALESSQNAEASATSAGASATTATNKAAEAVLEAARAKSEADRAASFTRDLGLFATVAALQTAYPTAVDGSFARVTATETYWDWDEESLVWVDSLVSFTGGGGSYEQLPDKPQIDGIVLHAGNNTRESLGIAKDVLATADTKGQIRIGTGLTTSADGIVSVDSDAFDHTKLKNREANDQHPINSITGLQTAIDAIATTISVNEKEFTQVDGIVTLPNYPSKPDDVGADPAGSAAAALVSAKEYTDTHAPNIKIDWRL